MNPSFATNTAESHESAATVAIDDSHLAFETTLQRQLGRIQLIIGLIGLIGVCAICFTSKSATPLLEHLSFFTATFFEHFLAPLFYLNDPGRRIFWLYLVIAAVFSCWWIYFLGRKQSAAHRESMSQGEKPISFSRLWRWFFHPEASTDAGLMLLNSFLRLTFLLPLIGSQLALSLAFAKHLQVTLGNSPAPELPYWLIVSLFTLCYFLIEDFSRFWLHRQMHCRRFLWKLHRTHHSATVLTPLTLFRVHPLEMALYTLRATLVLSIVAGSFVYLFKGQVGGWEILGVDALGLLFNAALANLRHSHIHISFGPFERLFISPAQHQLHHSREYAHRNRNFGAALSCWDRLYGSFLPGRDAPTKNDEPWLTALRFGLK